MRNLLGVILSAGLVAGLATAVSTSGALADYHGGGYKAPKKVYVAPKKVYVAPKKVYVAPKKVYVPVYSGEYPPAYCYPGPTYDPPSGYSEGCAPPQEWVSWCDYKYKSFNEYNGYYKGYDGYYHYCGQ
jgi:hypothetical protein